MTEQVTKKEWTEPELIVLVRNQPEEAVLGGCKYTNLKGSLSYKNACQYDSGCWDPCYASSKS